jgi:hypothetical protein
MSDDAPVRRSGLLALLALLGAFALGMITGGSLLHLWQAGRPFPPPPPRREPPVVHLQRELGLSPEQSSRVRRVLEEGRGEMRAQADRTRDRIREVLTPDQRRRFDAMRPPPPPPPLGAPPPPPPPD